MPDNTKKDAVYPDYTLICDTKETADKPSVNHFCLDYIMLQKNKFIQEGNTCAVTAFLNLPKTMDTKMIYIPGEEWPSDHFSLKYEIIIGFDQLVKKQKSLSAIADTMKAKINKPEVKKENPEIAKSELTLE